MDTYLLKTPLRITILVYNIMYVFYDNEIVTYDFVLLTLSVQTTYNITDIDTEETFYLQIKLAFYF